MRGLIASGQAEEDAEGTVILVPGFDQNDWKSAVPKELNEQINARLNNLSDESLEKYFNFIIENLRDEIEEWDEDIRHYYENIKPEREG
mgnify:CR=1 FL=1